MKNSISANINQFMTLFFLFCIGFYRVVFSWFFGGSCRFHPTCSVYAEQAFKSYGPAKALKFVFLRLGRCHPFGSFGEDPLPQKDNQHKGLQNV